MSRHRNDRAAGPEEVTSVDAEDDELEGPFDIDDFDDPSVATLAPIARSAQKPGGNSMLKVRRPAR